MKCFLGSIALISLTLLLFSPIANAEAGSSCAYSSWAGSICSQYKGKQQTSVYNTISLSTSIGSKSINYTNGVTDRAASKDTLIEIVWVFSLMLILVSSLGVMIDAAVLGVRKRCLGGGFFDMGYVGWFICCLCFWIISFPAYLITRSKYKELKRNNSFSVAGTYAYPFAHGNLLKYRL